MSWLDWSCDNPMQAEDCYSSESRRQCCVPPVSTATGLRMPPTAWIEEGEVLDFCRLDSDFCPDAVMFNTSVSLLIATLD